MPSLKDQVAAALSKITMPGTGKDIVAAGAVSDIYEKDGKVMLSISVPADKASRFEPIRAAAEAAVKSIPGVTKATVALTAEVAPGSAPKAPPAQGHAHSHGAPAKNGIPGVKSIIAVASGKGGVGKSTTAVNFALALAARGLKVGILDADIYGPSVPRLMGLSGEKPEVNEDRTLVPLENYGLKVMSIGFLVEEETPMIWRAPMAVSALTQMLRESAWDDLDVLVVDMPPGTGDVQLTMAQQVPLTGAVIVSTPQDLALLDARRGVAMFQKVEVPVLGIVENMAYFICPNCGTHHDIFGHGGAAQEARRIGVPFLGEVPLEMRIRETSDAGLPVVATEPNGPHAESYLAIADRVLDTLAGKPERVAPRIVIE
ncbi:iron-sulfur cluster carrier protein ApbC [Pleomorphomonas diazotrophica]|uniref:Iron-sulfur cluster carrier protein n=1 Tax=Pleomorphomonas diazotrophica TaxID=1166257 RepID=A0A1I4WD47_9HYPH|nr:iron-sulfur cluster carrier protein ApbC [Pleomorphomonas diazotrophica]PKR88994.1 iron-sulfur cluster carrier protein ApbC [Pleomorphomonas diazotrophica]SFN11681.1 ATP-binding protein involved in chromosome partitioning [Pleomorphomonas diazotrophica]